MRRQKTEDVQIRDSEVKKMQHVQEPPDRSAAKETINASRTSLLTLRDSWLVTSFQRHPESIGEANAYMQEKKNRKAVLRLRHSPKQSSCQVCALVRVVITIIQLSSAQNGGQQTIDHVTEEVRCMYKTEKQYEAQCKKRTTTERQNGMCTEQNA